MLSFWIVITVFLLLSILLVIPALMMKINHGYHFAKKTFILWIILIPCLSVSLYFYYGDYTKVIDWNQKVELHNKLQHEIKQYGSVDKMIQKFIIYVNDHPKDAKGWYILSKIYRSQNKIKKADQALQKAYTLDPNISKATKK